MASKTPHHQSNSPPFEYNPKGTYSFEQFELLNDWLETHELVIDKVPISHFELEKTGKLIPVPQTPIYKEVVVAEIARQISDWNINTRQNGVVTSSQGGFNLSTVGGRQIRAPDVALTTRETYRQLSMQQLTTFRGQAFSPIFVVEVEDLTENTKLTSQTNKFKEEYFPAGVEFGLLVDPMNKTIYTFKRNNQGVVRRTNRGWRDIDGEVFLPGFNLRVALIDYAVSQKSPEQSSDDDDDELELECPRCDNVFNNYHSFLEHVQTEHARKMHRRQ